MRVLGQNILIQVIAEEVVTDSGLILSEEEANINARYRKARVHQSGEDSTIEDGSVIYYDRSAGHSLMLDGETFTVITQRDVLVVL
jgi:co-chaperonin GroES (HSP10)